MLKTKKIIKVVDISADETVMPQVEPIVNIEKPIVEPIVDIEEQTVDIEKVRECSQLPIVEQTVDTQEAPIKNEFKKIVKTTNLTECANCHKMIMNKTLKYSHSKTCGIVKNTKIINTPDVIHVDESIIKPVNDAPTIKKPITAIRTKSNVIKHVKSVRAIKQLVTVDNTPPIMTLDEMRRQYFNNAKQQRIQRTSALFANAF